MSIEEKLREIIAKLEGGNADANKFDRGNASAGVRVRKKAQECVVALKELRRLVSDVKKGKTGN